MPNEDNVLHKLDADKAVRDFCDLICGDDINKSDVLYAATREKSFEWSGGRLFAKMAGGERIAATDPRVKEFFADKYPFLMPQPKATDQEFNGQTFTIDPATIASALSGSLTAKGTIARAFGADNTSSAASRAAAAKAELFLRAEAAKLGTDTGTGNDMTNVPAYRPPGSSTNPFYKLRRPDGSIDKAVEAQIGGMIAAMGHKKVADIAKAAKSPAAPMGLTLTGFPLKA
jgi:hypothetical protein